MATVLRPIANAMREARPRQEPQAITTRRVPALASSWRGRYLRISSAQLPLDIHRVLGMDNNDRHALRGPRRSPYRVTVAYLLTRAQMPACRPIWWVRSCRP